MAYTNDSAKDLSMHPHRLSADSTNKQEQGLSSNTSKQEINENGATKKFVCGVCDASFTMIGNLNRHKKGHSNHRPYTCNFCLRGFLRRTSYIEHIRLHTGEKPYVCLMCNQTFVRKKCHQMHIRKCKKIKGRATHQQMESLPDIDPAETAGAEFQKQRNVTAECSNDEKPLDLSSKGKSSFYSSHQTEQLQRIAKHIPGGWPQFPQRNPRNSSPQGSSGSAPYTDSSSCESQSPLGFPSHCSQMAANSSSILSCIADYRLRQTTPPISWILDTEHHTQNKQFPFRGIYQTLASVSSADELEAREGQLWHCKHCRIYFADRSMHSTHMAMHDERNHMTCTVCSKTCKNAHEFLIHH